MADIKDQRLDADILQAKMDILRIRQSILNSKSGQLAGEEVRAADSMAGLRAENEEKSREPEVKIEEKVEEKIEISSLPVVAESPAIIEESPAIEEVVESAGLKFEPMVKAQEPQMQEQGIGEADSASEYAVTKEEMDALLKDEGHAEEYDDHVMEEIFGEASPTVSDSHGESHDEEIAEIIAEAEEWMKTVAPEEKSEIPNPQSEAVEAESGVGSVTGSVQEIQNETIEDPKEASVEETLPVIEVSQFDDEGMVLGESSGEGQDAGFDEVVSDLQGEELIVPIEAVAEWEEELGLEMPQNEMISSEAAKAEELHEPVIEVVPVEIAATAASQVGEMQEMDVQLRIIRDMKEEGEKGDNERAGIPRLDLSESALGEVVEARKNASATRKGPGRREKSEIRSSKPETTEEKTEISNLKSKKEEEEVKKGVTPAPMAPTVTAESVEEKVKQEKERRVVAQIVAKDIERLCAIAAARARQKDVTVKR